MYSFNGTQYVQAIMPEKMTTQVEDMYFRFKTNRPLAVLMKTFDSSWDRLEIALIVGKIRLALKIGDKEKVLINNYYYLILVILLSIMYTLRFKWRNNHCKH